MYMVYVRKMDEYSKVLNSDGEQCESDSFERLEYILNHSVFENDQQ